MVTAAARADAASNPFSKCKSLTLFYAYIFESPV
jgi:hypothetical protein